MRTITRAAAVVILVISAQLGIAAPAAGHHGFGGRYDRSRPLYASGVVTTATYVYPHALITIRPSDPTMPPPDLAALDEASYMKLGGRDVVTRTQPIDATGNGVLTLLLPPPMTTEVSFLPAPPARGDSVGAIVFRECDTGELRVQLLRISAQQRIVRNGVIQREVDGCQPVAASPTGTAPPTVSAVARVSSEPVVVPTKEQADQTSLALLLLAAAAAAAVALGLGLLAARRG